jgi:SAM-dependent methyltransferase
VSGVRDYYQANTWKFLLFGAEGAIHRELWVPGVTSKRAAMHHAHTLMLAELRAVRPDGRARVLDLGCGVGSAALFLAEHVPARVYGVSLSPRQVALARRWTGLRQRRLQGECTFHEADFCAFSDALAAELQPIDLAFAIEAFVHAPSADAFFRQAARVLRPGGRLVVVDDVRVEGSADAPPLEDFRAGWRVQSLLTVGEASRLAAMQGLAFVDSVDLSSFQRLGRPRDRVIRACQPLLRRVQNRSPWAASLVGGDALQRSHRLGLLEYRMLRFEKR